jgi:serine/threonine protein phosphatase 1
MKLFVVSDTHSYFDEMIKALNEAGFDKENPNHMLIHCGDTIDRGPKPAEMIDYLMALPNKVLVRGNHETLMLNMMQRGFPCSNDFHNGTYQTVLDLAPNTESFTKACSVAYSKMKPMLDIMVDYFETQHYIFTHGYIPFCVDWRNASYNEWEEARWLNGFDESEFYTVEGKQIVVGHWHCSYANHKAYRTPEWGEGANFEPYIDNDIICIDACTAYTKKVNVLVLEDNLI